MFGNRIVVSKDQKELVAGIAKYTSSNQSEISYNIVEFGVAFLIALSYERKPDEGGDAGIPVAKLIEMWKEKPETAKFSDAVVKFLKLENKKDYIGNVGWMASFIGVHTIDVAKEQKATIRKLYQATGVPERALGHCIFESGITFMMLANSTPDEVKDTIREWLYDDDIMKIAHSLRDSWDSSKYEGVSSADSVDMSKYGLKGDAVLKKGIENIQDDTYFIKRKSDGYYVHFGEEGKDVVIYCFKKEKVGACGWHKKEGETFIEKNKLTGIAELVHAKSDLTKDTSQ